MRNEEMMKRAQRTVCRYYDGTPWSCIFGDKCWYIHQAPLNQGWQSHSFLHPYKNPNIPMIDPVMTRQSGAKVTQQIHYKTRHLHLRKRPRWAGDYRHFEQTLFELLYENMQESSNPLWALKRSNRPDIAELPEGYPTYMREFERQTRRLDELEI